MTASSLPARPGSCSLLSVLPYRDRNIIVWGMDHEEEEMDCVSVLSGHVQDVKFVRFNPRNNNLYSCSYDDTVKVWLYDGEDYSNINT